MERKLGDPKREKKEFVQHDVSVRRTNIYNYHLHFPKFVSSTTQLEMNHIDSGIALGIFVIRRAIP